jgi:hypothetical protein
MEDELPEVNIFDKCGVEQALNTKDIAEPLATLVDHDDNPVEQSRDGIGATWKVSSGADMAALFGSGGWQDGKTALIMSGRNTQVEDAMTYNGMGDRQIDVNDQQYNISNTNNEFTWSQFKNGLDRWEPRFQLGGSQLAAGDYGIRIDGMSNAYDETMQALGDIVAPVFKLDGESPADQSVDRRVGINPFQMAAGKKKEAEQAGPQGPGDSEPKPPDEDISYYYNDGFADPNSEHRINRNFQTGLRRQNVKNQQSRLLARMDKGADIYDSVMSAHESYANVLKEHFNDAYMEKDDKKEILARLRTPTSKYLSSQIGVNDVSRDMARVYTKKRGRPTKLNSQLIGS